MLTHLRFALRSLRKAPGFTATAVVTLALGLGASSAAFSLANWLTLRPVPGVADQERLAAVDFHAEALGGVSYPNLVDVRERIKAVSGLAGFSGTKPIVVHLEGQTPRYLRGALVSADYFKVLGVRMALGRGFTADEEAVAATSLVAVISHRLWSTMFGTDREVVGRTLTSSGLRAVVIGVAPRDFRGAELQSDQDIWVPASAFAALAHLGGWDPMQSRSASVFEQLVGRLAVGATLDQVRAQVDAAAAALAEAYPQDNERWKKTPPTVLPALGMSSVAREAVRRTLTLLGAVTVLVLLIAWANVANLLLFRGVTRRGEVTVRRALGASHVQLTRSRLAEALLLASAAGVLGLMIAVWLTSLFRGLSLPGAPSLTHFGDIGEVRTDWRVLAFGMGVALVTGALFGFVPALAAVRVDLMAGLKASATRGSVGGGRLRNALATFQLAVSVALLVGALLLVATVRNLARIPIGFDAHRITTFTIWPPYSGYTRDQTHALLRDVLPRIRSLPGVEEASITSYPPFSVSIGDRIRNPDAPPPGDSVPVTAALVAPGYFRTMGIPLLGGRDFREGEMFLRRVPSSQGVAILSVSQAIKLFGTADVVGRVVSGEGPEGSYRIVGVARDSRWESLTTEGSGAPFYQPLPSYAEGGTIVVRSGLAPGALRAAVQRAISEAAPTVPVFDVERMSDKVSRSISQQRLLARVLSALTMLAVALADVGLYAVVAFSVAERTRELGIRVALGAQAKQILALVARQGARLGTIGLVLGLAGAAGLSRLVANWLYGVTPLQPAAYVLAGVLLLALVLLASLVPAYRATKADPMVALRAE